MRIKSFIRNVFFSLKGLKCILKSLLFGRRSLPQNRNDRNALIMGNGPSLKSVDVVNLSKNADVICVNYYAVNNKDFFIIRPEYYCFLDPVFFNSNPDKKTAALIKTLESVDWNLKIITVQGNKLPIENKNIEYEYISIADIYGNYCKKFLNYLHKKNLANCGLQNVLAGAIYYCILNGYHKVLVCGFDMSEFQAYSVNKDNHILVKYSHFYGDEYIDATESGRIKLGDFYFWINCYAKMFEQFHYLSEFAIEQGVDVINLTTESFVDSFKKDYWKNYLNT